MGVQGEKPASPSRPGDRDRDSETVRADFSEQKGRLRRGVGRTWRLRVWGQSVHENGQSENVQGGGHRKAEARRPDREVLCSHSALWV